MRVVGNLPMSNGERGVHRIKTVVLTVLYLYWSAKY